MMKAFKKILVIAAILGLAFVIGYFVYIGVSV